MPFRHDLLELVQGLRRRSDSLWQRNDVTLAQAFYLRRQIAGLFVTLLFEINRQLRGCNNDVGDALGLKRQAISDSARVAASTWPSHRVH